MTNPLSKLKLDYWYKALVALSAVLLLMSLTVDLKGIENSIAQLLCLGSLFIGIGEWINHPLQTAIMPPNAYYAPGGAKITSYSRKPCLLGSLFDVLGFTIVAVGVYKLVQ